MDELYRIGVKILAQEREPLDLLELIPVFHRWVQAQDMEDLLIDVAEYTHAHHGPGVLVVAHEGNYGYDEAGGERGLVYYSKHPLPGSDLDARMEAVARKLLTAAQRLVGESEIAGRLSFSGRHLEVFANDRLAAPNTAEAWDRFEPRVRRLAERLYGDDDFHLVRVSDDPRERLAAAVSRDEGPGLATLRQRLAA